MRFAVLTLMMLLTVSCSTTTAYEDTWAEAVVQARQSNEAAPVRHHLYKDMHLQNAYAVQRKVVKSLSLSSAMVGYKGGLTAAGAPRKFSLNEAVVGAMLLNESASSALSLGEFQRLVIELELGFFFSAEVSQPIADVAQLKSKISVVRAMVELPDFAYQDMQLFTGYDLIANNVSAQRFIVGDVIADGIDIDSIATKLSCDDRVLSQGSSGEVNGGQWQTLLWLVNKLISVGYRIEPGQFVLSGSLGKVATATAADCIATFEGSGRIDFTIMP